MRVDVKHPPQFVGRHVMVNLQYKHKCSFLSIFSPFCFRIFLFVIFWPGCSVHAHTMGVFRPTKKGISRIKEQNHKTGHSKQIASHARRVNVETSRGNNYHTWELLCRARANKTFPQHQIHFLFAVLRVNFHKIKKPTNFTLWNSFKTSSRYKRT